MVRALRATSHSGLSYSVMLTCDDLCLDEAHSGGTTLPPGSGARLAAKLTAVEPLTRKRQAVDPPANARNVLSILQCAFDTCIGLILSVAFGRSHHASGPC